MSWWFPSQRRKTQSRIAVPSHLVYRRASPHICWQGAGQPSWNVWFLLTHRRLIFIVLYRDAANLLKPELARGQFRCIGATTLAEYREHIEKDGALTRRFAQVCTMIVQTPFNSERITTIGDGQRAYAGSRQNYITWFSRTIREPPSCLDYGSGNSYCGRSRPPVSHSKEVYFIQFIIVSRSRILTLRCRLPDSAFDLMDEACASARVQQDLKPETIEELEQRMTQHKTYIQSLEVYYLIILQRIRATPNIIFVA